VHLQRSLPGNAPANLRQTELPVSIDPPGARIRVEKGSTMPQEHTPIAPSPASGSLDLWSHRRAAITRVVDAIAGARLARDALTLTVERLPTKASDDAAPLVIGSRLGGAPYEEGDEPWPACAECGKPMTFFGQINLDELPPVGAPGHGLVEAFCCDTGCGAWDGHAAKGLWAFRHYPRPAAGRRHSPVPGPTIDAALFRADAVITFPSWEDTELPCPEIRRLCIAEAGFRDSARALYQAACGVLGGYQAIGHQIGGWPQWLERGGESKCVRCGEPMRLLWRIDSLGAKGLKFGDTGLMYLLGCPDDPDETLLRTQCC
jgi:hypothetical protein